MSNFQERIGLNFKLDKLSKVVCEEYSIGSFVENKLIEVGYEDFNFILTTDIKKYVVKVFSNERTDKMCQELVERQAIPHSYGFSCPEIYKNNNGKLLSIVTLNGIDFRFCVVEYINGIDFFRMEALPNDDEIKEIAKQLSILNNIDYKPEFIYDRWSIVNFVKEYEENKEFVPEGFEKEIEDVYKQFKKLDLTKLKYGFVHGDIIVTNIMKDDKDKLYYIDFSVANYLPRLVDMAVTICDLCIDVENLFKSQERIDIFLAEYNNNSQLTDYELEVLPLFLRVHQAQTVLQTHKQLIKYHNDSKENIEFFEEGLIGLELVKKLKIGK